MEILFRVTSTHAYSDEATVETRTVLTLKSMINPKAEREINTISFSITHDGNPTCKVGDQFILTKIEG